jgi:hypothetical protein
MLFNIKTPILNDFIVDEKKPPTKVRGFYDLT